MTGQERAGWRRRRDQLIASGAGCHWCGFAVRARPGENNVAGDTATMDHLTPWSKGGRAGEAVLACSSCNDARKAMLVTEWEAALGGFASEWKKIPPATRPRLTAWVSQTRGLSRLESIRLVYGEEAASRYLEKGSQEQES